MSERASKGSSGRVVEANEWVSKRVTERASEWWLYAKQASNSKAKLMGRT